MILQVAHPDQCGKVGKRQDIKSKSPQSFNWLRIFFGIGKYL
jgi:hypothetical protein